MSLQRRVAASHELAALASLTRQPTAMLTHQPGDTVTSPLRRLVSLGSCCITLVTPTMSAPAWCSNFVPDLRAVSRAYLARESSATLIEPCRIIAKQT